MRAIAWMLAAIVLASGFAFAGGCERSTSQADVDTGTLGLGPRHYVSEDCGLSDLCTFSLWIYEESNGLEGLQRHDEVVDDTCGATAGAGDTIVF